MSQSTLKDEVIGLLLAHLPSICSSLGRMTSCLQDLSITESGEFYRKLLGAVQESESILDHFEALKDSLDVQRLKDHKDEFALISFCVEAIGGVLKGMRALFAWIRDENHPPDKLKESVDLLFDAGQQLAKVVDVLTTNGE